MAEPVPASIDSQELRRHILAVVQDGVPKWWSLGAERWYAETAKIIAKERDIPFPNWELTRIVKDMTKAVQALCTPPKVRRVGPTPRRKRSPI